jgi:hypothetical protein
MSRGNSVTSRIFGAPMNLAVQRSKPTANHRGVAFHEVTSTEVVYGYWLVAHGLSGVALVTSDAHPGLVATIGATLPRAAWQRCRTHYADVRIMPIWVVSALVVGPGGLLKSA